MKPRTTLTSRRPAQRERSRGACMRGKRLMVVLGIETSCDETAAALAKNGTKILSNVVASSVELHQKTGGIIPEVAAREQVRCIVPVIEEALENAKVKMKDLGAIAVTVGPGLIGSLLVGVETAKTLAFAYKKPIIPVNHLQAHLYANWLNSQSARQLGSRQRSVTSKIPKFPAIGLVVSGGHTDLVLMKDHGKIKWLGGTRDDAAGECFDKTARVLGLGYPGGPEIARLAEKGNPKAYKLPRPMLGQENYDFSFSGLKTAVINLTKKQKKIDKADLAASIQEAITDCLVKKTLNAAEKYKVKSILLAGGVAANKKLREKMEGKTKDKKYALFVPTPTLCTDNASYIASCAYFNLKPEPWEKIKADPGLPIA